MSFTVFKIREWYDYDMIWRYDDIGLELWALVLSQWLAEVKGSRSLARSACTNEEWQQYQFWRCVQPMEIAPPKPQVKAQGWPSLKAQAEPARHLGRPRLSETTFFNTNTSARLTSSGAEARRGQLLLKKVWLLQNKGGSKSTSEAVADHLRSLARSPYRFSSSAELLTEVVLFFFLSSPSCSAIQHEEQHQPPTTGGLNQNLLVSTALQEKSGHSPAQTDCHYTKAWVVFQLQVEFSYDKPEADSLFHCTKYIELAISL